MDYQGPTAEDFRNIRALNMAFLRATNCSDCALDNGITRQPLTEMQIRRLGEAPFLLFSFRERDTGYWKRILTGDLQQDLLQPAAQQVGRLHELQVAGLGFVWQLSRRNPYVARLACGASAQWCESIARLTIVELIGRAAGRRDLTLPRFDAGDHVGHRLGNSGTSARRKLQHMSQQFALQAMLTGRSAEHYEKLAAAACRFPGVAKRVADRDKIKRRKV